MIVDTHVHVWQPDDGHRVLIRERIAALDADFGFETLLPMLAPAGVEQVVLVSAAQSFAETERLLSVAERFSSSVAGVIGYLDLDATDFDRRLEEASVHAALVGLRLPLVVYDDDDWLGRPCVQLALQALAARGLVAQVLAAPRHLKICAEVLARYPDLTIVIDHAGNPGPQHINDAVWRDGLVALATQTAALCKIGEFSLPTGPSADEARCDAIFRHVLRCFGESRLIFGSNWPVSTLHRHYSDARSDLRAAATRAGLDAEQLERSMTGNALRFYAPAPFRLDAPFAN